MSDTHQRDGFGAGARPPVACGVSADVVLDRPLDHAFTYGVPPDLAGRVGAGKRVRAPFGRGDKTVVGYCVRVHGTPPAREAKALLAALDEQPLLTADLLRLTRWMADYYICARAQVLTAAVPAGARDRAGTRNRTFLEAVPEDELPQPAPKLSPRQTAALEHLRTAGRAVELTELARLADCGTAPVEALVQKGLARRVQVRVDRFTDTTHQAQPPPHPIPELNAPHPPPRQPP